LPMESVEYIGIAHGSAQSHSFSSMLRSPECCLRCLETFGKARSISRREQMGISEFAWPCLNILTLSGQGGTVAAWLLQVNQASMEITRDFQADVYLEEWTAA